MNDKETLLATMASNWKRLAKALDGVPHEVLEDATLAEGRTIKAVCCLLTAWDGESMRRIEFVTGEQFNPPHSPHDTAYWDRWTQNQIETKSIMSMRGVMVDMVGTHQRLLARLDELNDFHFYRWLEEDPQAGAPLYEKYLSQIETWRAAWDIAHPPEKGIRKFLQQFKQKFSMPSN